MKLSRIKYAFSEAKKSIVRNGLMSFASLFTITCCLLILGVFAISAINVNNITEQIKDQCEVQIYIRNDATEERVNAIGEEVKRVDNVKEISLVTKEQTLEKAKNEVFKGKEEALAGFDEENPFSDSYTIVLKDIKKTAETVEDLKQIPDVVKVINKQNVVNSVLSISDSVKGMSIAVMIILFIIAIVIISNTVRLTVFNRRREINIMKYIGATDRFIRVPFILEGFIIGFSAAIVSCIIVFFGYGALLNLLNGNIEFKMLEFVGVGDIMWPIALLFVVFGSLIGILGSAISMRKHLHV